FTVVRYLAAASGNLLPVAVDDQAYTTPGQGVVIPVVANDLDGDGDSLTIVPGSIVPVSGPLLGTVTPTTDNGVANRSLLYTPPANPPGGFTGEAFRYTVDDGNGGTAMATVTVHVVTPPNLATALSNQSGLVENVSF